MKCISVNLTPAYMLCAGVKTIENRTWNTSYRGDLLIHTTGDQDCYDFQLDEFAPPNVISEFEKFRHVTKETFPDLVSITDYTTILKSHNFPKYIENYAKFLNKLKHFYSISISNPFFCVQQIIGKVTLENIIKDSKDPFADKNNYHWIVKDPILFKNPIPNIKGKLRLWDFEHPNLDLSPL